ncbi:MAG TPA: hypothetical protein VIF62_33165 [Labilithrix sp.]
MKPLSHPRFFTAVVLATILPLTAAAAVRREGNWPADDKHVSFEFDGKPGEGLKQLADEAGWSLVMSKGVDVGASDVHIDVKDQPADAVLDALFADGNVVARRSGSLLTITPADGAASAPAQSATTPPVVPPVPTVRGEDRNVVGGSANVEKGDIVHTLTITGGSAKVRGTVTGDLVVAGGSVKIEEGGRVVGNVTVFGGSVKVERGGRIDGDVGVVGGSLKREDGSFVGGQVVDRAQDKHGKISVKVDDGNVSTSVKPDPPQGRIQRAAHSFGESLTKMALLFVLGCVFLALGTQRMEMLRVEAAARPMRSFAMGILGAIGAFFVVVGGSITIVGIPFVVLGVLLATFALYVAIAAVLTTFGHAVLGHKTQNPYLHLLFGCGVFLILGAIPYVGGLVTFVVVMIAIGILVSTRIGGLAASRRPKPQLV